LGEGLITPHSIKPACYEMKHRASDLDGFFGTTYSIIRGGKNLSDAFHIQNSLKKGDALSPLLFNFILEYDTRKVQENQEGLKVNGTHHVLVYADDFNKKT
jgi:hypothetical protein